MFSAALAIEAPLDTARAAALLCRSHAELRRRIFARSLLRHAAPLLFPQRSFQRYCAWSPPVRRSLARLPRGFVTHYSLAAEAAHWLYVHTRHTRPKTVLECGCGVSSLVQAMALHGDNQRIVALETGAHWRARTLSVAGALGVAQRLDVRLVSFDACPRGAPRQPGYPAAAVADLSVDLLFIDAPTHAVGRAGVLPSLRHVLRPGAGIFLDDAFRHREHRCVEDWTAAGLARLEGYLPLGSGLAWLTAL